MRLYEAIITRRPIKRLGLPLVLVIAIACNGGDTSSAQYADAQTSDLRNVEGGFCMRLEATVRALWPEDLDGRSWNDLIDQDIAEVDTQVEAGVCYYQTFDGSQHRIATQFYATDPNGLGSCDNFSDDRSDYQVVSYCAETSSLGSDLFTEVNGRDFLFTIMDGSNEPTLRERMVLAADTFLGDGEAGEDGPPVSAPAASDGCIELQAANRRVLSAWSSDSADAQEIAAAYASAYGAAAGSLDDDLRILSDAWTEIGQQSGGVLIDPSTSEFAEAVLGRPEVVSAMDAFFEHLLDRRC